MTVFVLYKHRCFYREPLMDEVDQMLTNDEKVIVFGVLAEIVEEDKLIELFGEEFLNELSDHADYMKENRSLKEMRVAGDNVVKLLVDMIKE